MSAEQEHGMVRAIRGWLAATSDIEIPVGLSREEARRRGRELLAAIPAASLGMDHLDVDDDLMDTLWAAVEELDGKPLGQQTLEDCDRFYQFVLNMWVIDGPFDERDEILHRVARIGWRSAPGGLEAVLMARAAIWKHRDEQHHRELCETSDQIPARLKELGRQQVPDPGEIREICSGLLELNSVCPSSVLQWITSLDALLAREEICIGYLDDRDYLRASAAFIAGTTRRQLGELDAAKSAYLLASSTFRRTADTCDLDRVEVEHLALRYVEKDFDGVCMLAPSVIETLRLPRERAKAQILLADCLLSLERADEATQILEATRCIPVVETEPILRAWLLMKLGNGLSCLGRNAEAMAALSAAAEVLNRFHNPSMLATLTAILGEHVGRAGNLSQSVVLYGKAREMFIELGQAQMVGYVSVLIAEALILLDRSEEAQAELIAALPLIERFDLRREAVVAVTLLREAIGKRRTDVKTIQALRDQLRKGLH